MEKSHHLLYNILSQCLYIYWVDLEWTRGKWVHRFVLWYIWRSGDFCSEILKDRIQICRNVKKESLLLALIQRNTSSATIISMTFTFQRLSWHYETFHFLYHFISIHNSAFTTFYLSLSSAQISLYKCFFFSNFKHLDDTNIESINTNFMS